MSDQWTYVLSVQFESSWAQIQGEIIERYDKLPPDPGAELKRLEWEDAEFEGFTKRLNEIHNSKSDYISQRLRPLRSNDARLLGIDGLIYVFEYSLWRAYYAVDWGKGKGVGVLVALKKPQ
jgi:hypothetical protein